jgi:hypothetical protein
MRKKNVYFEKNNNSVCLLIKNVSKEVEKKNVAPHNNNSNKPWSHSRFFFKESSRKNLSDIKIVKLMTTAHYI